MFGLFKKKAQQVPQPTAEQIVPRIKHLNFRAAVAEIAAKDPASRPLIEPFVGDLLITYAFDLPESFMMVREVDRERLGLSLEQLRAKALENLRKGLPPVQQGGKPPLMMLAVGNNLEACLLLIDELWEKASANVPGRLVVSVPSRDVLMFTSSERADGIQQMRQLAKEAREREPVHGLSEHLLAWDGGKWAVFKGGSTANEQSLHRTDRAE